MRDGECDIPKDELRRMLEPLFRIFPPPTALWVSRWTTYCASKDTWSVPMSSWEDVLEFLDTQDFSWVNVMHGDGIRNRGDEQFSSYHGLYKLLRSDIEICPPGAAAH